MNSQTHTAASTLARTTRIALADLDEAFAAHPTATLWEDIERASRAHRAAATLSGQDMDTDEYFEEVLHTSRGKAMAAIAAETEAAAEHARIRAERDAKMSALIKAEAARRGLPPGRFTYMSC